MKTSLLTAHVSQGENYGKLFSHRLLNGQLVNLLTAEQIESLNFDPFELSCEITGRNLETWLNMAAVGDCFAIELNQGFFYRIK